QQQFINFISELGTPVTWFNATDGKPYQFTEDYAKSINDRIYKDSLFRSTMQGIWGEAAKTQYQAIYNDPSLH
ncbi:MAG: transporter substrate-binding protein, partial [Thermoproteota archaeon]|nr:transporter substrate-binding protein [Thermoproteota archaeon]